MNTAPPEERDDTLPYWMEHDEPDWDADPSVILERLEEESGVSLWDMRWSHHQ